MSDKPPFILEPTDQSTGRPATFIFIHGYGDDAEGLPMGLAQQFQWYNKMQYLHWLLPNAPMDREAATRAWYKVKQLPNAAKPKVPGHEEEDADAGDDEEGILNTCATIDQLVKGELDRGVEPGRVVVGGFSQGCAVSLVWGLIGEYRNQVAGIFAASGYYPLADRIATLRKERGIAEGKDNEKKKWLYIHGSKDILVPGRFFEQGKRNLKEWIDEGDLEEHLYEGMGHSTCNSELRDLLLWLNRVVPP